ncbi:MAG TPA: benzoate-CoA ligase family protein [Streptosporangiaceae bacterium]
MAEVFNACTYLVDRHVEAGHGDRMAVTGPRGDLTYGELRERAGRVAAGLRALRTRPEERVLIFMADGPDMISVILGAMRMGAVPVPVSTMLSATDLAGLLRDSRARTLVAGPEFAATAQAAARQVPELAGVILDCGGLDGADTSVYPTSPDGIALWLYTSGTTGRPKGAMHRHASLRSVVETYGTQVLGIGPDDRCLSASKLFFAYGLGASCLFPLGVGASVSLLPGRSTPDAIAERLRADRPTLFFAVPTFYSALLNAELPAETFASVRQAVSAGEPLPAQLYQRFLDRYGVEIIDGLGSTEALHIFLSNRPGRVRPGTTGVPVPGYDLRVVDDEGRDVPPGTAGHLMVRGDSIATGYWCRTETTRRVFQGEWLRTGDTYLADQDGYFHYLGRSNDMIKSSGVWVSPTEVEARLLQHPEIAEAVVVGAADAEGLEKPVAGVVRTEGSKLAAGDILEFCRDGLPAFKRPRAVLFLDAVPTTATGKVQRFVVREMARNILHDG